MRTAYISEDIHRAGKGVQLLIRLLLIEPKPLEAMEWTAPLRRSTHKLHIAVESKTEIVIVKWNASFI